MNLSLLNDLFQNKKWFNSITWPFCSKGLSLKANLSALCLEILSKIQYPLKYEQRTKRKQMEKQKKPMIESSERLRTNRKISQWRKAGTIWATDISNVRNIFLCTYVYINLNIFAPSKFTFQNINAFGVTMLEIGAFGTLLVHEEFSVMNGISTCCSENSRSS